MGNIIDAMEAGKRAAAHGGKYDQIIMTSTEAGITLECLGCGQVYTVNFPLPVDEFCELIEFFTKHHHDHEPGK